MLPRWAWWLLVALVVGVLVAVLPLPSLVSTIGNAAAVVCAVVGLVLLLVDALGGARR